MFGEQRNQKHLETLPGTVVEYFNGRNGHYAGLDLQEKELRWVRFSGATLKDCDFRNASFQCVFADFAVFENCLFDGSCLSLSVFAGSRLNRCSFVDSTANTCNFNAIAATLVDFSGASLRGTRFINARLNTVQFINCDIRDALFHFSLRNEVVFKHSNYEEARF